MFENKTNYAVVKFAKLKTTGEMAASAAHNFRKEQPDNADPAKAYLNEELIKLESQDYIDAYKNKLAEQNIQPKKGCIKALEVMMTFTGKQSEVDLEEWKKRSVEWVRNYFGKDNVISAIYHGDESSPHIHAVVVPIVDGRLYASEYINGRERCAAMQTSYAESVKKLGLERGMESTPVSYKTMQQLRNATQKVAQENLPAPIKGENLEDYYARANEHYKSERLANYRKQTDIMRQAEKSVEEYKRIAESAEKSKNQMGETLQLQSKEMQKVLSGQGQIIESLQRTLNDRLVEHGMSNNDYINLSNLNKVVSAFKQKLLGEENDIKQKEMFTIMNEALAAYEKVQRERGGRMDNRENGLEIENVTIEEK